jgi:NAD(P)-dependent dehydrogenase (short-subunit alcohol dehydrogenase family)
MAVADMTVVLTGPTRGLGFDAALAMARAGTRLVLMGRDPHRLDVVAQAAQNAGAPEVTSVLCDFSSLSSVQEASADIASRVVSGELATLDVVVGNAGLQMNDRLSLSKDGYEATFAVNVLANHVLIRSLLPSASPDAHFVVVGSGTHFGNSRLVAGPVWAPPDVLAGPGAGGAPFEPDSGRAGQCAYSTSKLGVNYLVQAWQSRHESGARFNVYDPGLMPGTGLVRTGPAYRKWAWNHIMPLLTVLPGVTSTKNSAAQLAALSLGQCYPDARGAYIEIEKLSRASNESENKEREQQLWDFCEGIASNLLHGR